MTARVLVLASLPSCCAVCRGKRRVALVSRPSPMTGGHGATTRCPHCVDHVPVVHLPIREDIPRGAA